jgi:ribosomal protein L37AE/L43A
MKMSEKILYGKGHEEYWNEEYDCPFCGAREMLCGMNFCPNCGKSLEGYIFKEMDYDYN